MKTMSKIEPGIYTHYKGQKYQVIGEGVHTETREVMITYKSLYDAPGFPRGSIWVRPKKMFTEKVVMDSKTVPRFKSEKYS
jgi:hypothetical protein